MKSNLSVQETMKNHVNTHHGYRFCSCAHGAEKNNFQRFSLLTLRFLIRQSVYIVLISISVGINLSVCRDMACSVDDVQNQYLNCIWEPTSGFQNGNGFRF